VLRRLDLKRLFPDPNSRVISLFFCMGCLLPSRDAEGMGRIAPTFWPLFSPPSPPPSVAALFDRSPPPPLVPTQSEMSRERQKSFFFLSGAFSLPDLPPLVGFPKSSPCCFLLIVFRAAPYGPFSISLMATPYRFSVSHLLVWRGYDPLFCNGNWRLVFTAFVFFFTSGRLPLSSLVLWLSHFPS